MNIWVTAGIALLAALVGVGLAVGAALLLLRRSPLGRRFLALSLQRKLRFAREVAGHPALPVAGRLIVGALLLYLLFPLDLIPDVIPILGHADDVAVVALAAFLLWLIVPAPVWREALDRAEE